MTKCARALGLLAAVALTAFIAAPNARAALDCSKGPGALPDPALPAGTARADIPIQHIVVVMQENRSFDNYFGALSRAGYEGQIDGISPDLGNPDKNGKWVSVFHQTRACVSEGQNDWNTAREMWDGGRNDGFVTTNDAREMGYYDAGDQPFYYTLANRFAVADRYFSSVMAPTYPNRMFFMAGTSFGKIRNKLPTLFHAKDLPTIFGLLNRYHISWAYYYSDVPAEILFPHSYWHNWLHARPASWFERDAKRGRLPQVTFLESSQLVGTEYASFDYHVGQAALAKKIDALVHGRAWPSTAFFLAFDEGGGMFDHVPPPEACAPDDIPPQLQKGDTVDGFERYGFRVPFLLVSPYAKRHYVSHVVYDHTSILKFIETKFNLPALTRRDANADAMMDLFDFSSPDLWVPRLPKVTWHWKDVLYCLTHVRPAP